MMRRAGIQVAWLATTAVFAQGLAFSCVDSAGTEKIWAGTKKLVVKVIAAGAGENCSTTGTGFVVSAQGHVLTASHVVPIGCKDLVLEVRFEGRADAVPMKVFKRSTNDAVLLQPVKKQSASEYIQIDTSTAAEESYLEKRVVVVSFYQEDTRVTYTAAKMESVEMSGNTRGKWTVCGSGANPGRSGSPVLTEDAKAVAVFY